MSNPDGGYAFPMPIAVGPAGDVYATPQEAEFGSGGMTLRDYFAAQALASIIANNSFLDAIEKRHGRAVVEQVAHDAYGLADAMLAERQK